MEHDFTSGSVWKKMLLFAVPIFGANLLQALYGTVELFVTVGILLAVIVAVLAGGIVSVMNAPAEAFSQTTDYIRICGICIICIVMFNAIGGMFRGLGDSRTPLTLSHFISNNLFRQFLRRKFSKNLRSCLNFIR